jgi:hypothetical protein
MFLDPENRMFVGTFDDSVSRYPWADMRADVSYLNRVLIFHALLGTRLCSRIGSILYHEPYRIALMDETVSPLRELTRAGFMQLQMNGPTINESIANRLRARTNSTLAFVEQHQWRIGSEMYRRLEALNGELSATSGVLQYNPEFKSKFRHIMGRLAVHPSGSFQRVYEHWAREDDPAMRTRSQFEILAQRTFEDQPGRLRRAMQLVNAANHYAYGSSAVSDPRRTLVETEEISLLNDMTRTIVGDEDRTDEPDRFTMLIRLRAFDVVSANLHVPVSLLHSHETWNKFAKMLYPGHPSYDALMGHKRQIITSMNRLISGQSQRKVEETMRELGEQCQAYSRTIFRLLDVKHDRGFLPIVLEYSLEKITGQAAEDLIEIGRDMATEALGWKARLGLFAVRTLLSIGTDKVDEHITRVIDRHWVEGKAVNALYPEVQDVSRAFRYPSLKVMEPDAKTPA